MSENKKMPLPVDPEDGTRIYMPLGQRFSVGETLADITFDNSVAEKFYEDPEDPQGLR